MPRSTKKPLARARALSVPFLSRLLFLSPSFVPAIGFAQAAAPTPASVRVNLPLPLAANERLSRSVITHYAKLVSATYADHARAVAALEKSIGALVAKPSVATHKAAKTAWIRARKIYSLTEAFRFYGGPIDDPKEGPEGLMNSWPVDEAYIDYVQGKEGSGYVNNTQAYPEITRDLLLSLNQKEGDKNVSTGYHAIEFLLWGQDLDSKSAGKRPFADFVDNGKNNAARRAKALTLLAALLGEHARALDAAWKPGEQGNYAASFILLPVSESVQKILNGVATLSVDELAGERMIVPLDKKDQENEQNCFSDTTTNDIVADAVGIENVWTGTYGKLKGPGLQALVARLDAKLSANVTRHVKDTVRLASAIPAPFDNVILENESDPSRIAAQKTIAALEAQGQLFARAARAAGLRINVQFEEDAAKPADKESLK